MRIRGLLARIWAGLSILLVLAVILFLFVFIFLRGGSVITWDFLSQPPSGAVLGEEGGILPAITGSLAFTLTATVLAAFRPLPQRCIWCFSVRVGVSAA